MSRHTTKTEGELTEREGFEPSNEVDPRYAISSRARSTAPAPLRDNCTLDARTSARRADRASEPGGAHVLRKPLLGCARDPRHERSYGQDDRADRHLRRHRRDRERVRRLPRDPDPRRAAAEPRISRTPAPPVGRPTISY